MDARTPIKMTKSEQEIPVKVYVRLIRAAETLHATVSRGLTLEGLTASQFSTLKVLRIHGALAQRDIAKYILKSGGNITIVVDNLTRVGLVERTRDTEDRRIVFVKLTPLGEETFDRIYPGHLDRIRKVMGPLDDVECNRLLNLLEALVGDGSEPFCGALPEADGLAAV